MSIKTINKSKINDIFIYNGDGELGFKMMLALDNNKALYFNSLWMHYFNIENLENDFNFEKVDIDAGHIESVYCFEGVGFYIILSTGYIIHIYQEVFDYKKPDYKHTFKIVSDRDKDAYDKILNDIIEMEEPDDIIENPPKFW